MRVPHLFRLQEQSHGNHGRRKKHHAPTPLETEIGGGAFQHLEYEKKGAFRSDREKQRGDRDMAPHVSPV